MSSEEALTAHEIQMARKRTTSWQDIDARYWRAVKTQDEFWRETFVNFVKPLRGLYKDPLSAGAHVLSYYLSNPHGVERAFKSDPTAFGSLLFGAINSHAQQIYADLLLSADVQPRAFRGRGWPAVRAFSNSRAHTASGGGP